jgi:hypothetical protein
MSPVGVSFHGTRALYHAGSQIVPLPVWHGNDPNQYMAFTFLHGSCSRGRKLNRKHQASTVHYLPANCNYQSTFPWLSHGPETTVIFSKHYATDAYYIGHPIRCCMWHKENPVHFPWIRLRWHYETKIQPQQHIVRTNCDSFSPRRNESSLETEYETVQLAFDGQVICIDLE